MFRIGKSIEINGCQRDGEEGGGQGVDGLESDCYWSGKGFFFLGR